jgi:hypothetical protein
MQHAELVMPTLGYLSGQSTEVGMDDQTRHEIVVIALSTLAAIPVVASVGFLVASGIVAWSG